MTGDLDRIREIGETLFTGGYDATEGHDGSRDTTWTDFGETIGIAERLALDLSRLEARLAALDEYGKAGGA